MARSLFSWLYTLVTEALDQRVGWHRLPVPLGLLTLVGLRMRLRARNLYDRSPATLTEQPPAPEGERYLTVRTADGKFNDLENPTMGSAETRFGRNIPLEHTYPENDWSILNNPNPRMVSRELLTRDTFKPATTLNLLAAAWLQFMVRDWFSHEKGEYNNSWELPLREDDPWPDRPMRILRVPDDPTRTPAETGTPPTHLNTETHWWDASQIYGSDPAFQKLVRSGELGKLKVDPRGIIP